MIRAIINGIFSLIVSIVNVVLYPIDQLIETALPTLSSWISAAGTFIGYCTQSIGWVLSCIGITGNILSLIIAYYTFKLTVPLLVHTIKLAIKWYDKLKI